MNSPPHKILKPTSFNHFDKHVGVEGVGVDVGVALHEEVRVEFARLFGWECVFRGELASSHWRLHVSRHANLYAPPPLFARVHLFTLPTSNRKVGSSRFDAGSPSGSAAAALMARNEASSCTYVCAGVVLSASAQSMDRSTRRPDDSKPPPPPLQPAPKESIRQPTHTKSTHLVRLEG